MSPADVLAAFCLAFAADVLWVHLVRSSVEGMAGRAAVLSMLLAGLSLATVALLVMTSWLLFLPTIAGHGAGTWFSVYRSVAR